MGMIWKGFLKSNKVVNENKQPVETNDVEETSEETETVEQNVKPISKPKRTRKRN